MESLDEEERDQLGKMHPKEKLDGLSAEELLDLLPDPVPFNAHVLVAPLTDIISVRIRFDVNHDVQHKIYGTILVTDGEGNTFPFYNREDDNPETISNGGKLTLTFPKNHIIIPSNVVKVDVNLKDAINNVEIVKDNFNWNCMVEDGYGGINVVTFKGKCGSAILDYATFFHAVIIRINIILLRRGGDSLHTSAKIYGKIIARYSSNFSIILFGKDQDASIVQEYGTCIELSRHVVIAPALSLLEIYAKLFNGDTHEQIVEVKVEFDAIRYPTFGRNFEGKLRVGLERSYTYLQPPLLKDKRVQRENLSLDQRPSSTISINRNLQSPFGNKLFEFYSISIGGVNDEDIDLWGSINFYCHHNPHFSVFLFKKDKDSSHRLLPYQTVPMTSYTNCASGLEFCITTKLRDAKGRAISSGYMSWSDIPFETYKSLFNRHLCSIIRGTDGYYAAIHYSIFDAGVQAMVQIYLNKKTSGMKYVKTDGSICAQYSSYDYSIFYNKEYYRRQLFTGKSTEPLIHCSDSSVMLSESSVMVPMGSSLILDVNLEVTSKVDDNVNISNCVSRVGDSFEELLEFKIDMSRLTDRETMRKIERSSHLIFVHVEWRPVY